MSRWLSVNARVVLKALHNVGWVLKRQAGSHKTLARGGWPDYVFAFHEAEEVGPRMLARIAKENKALEMFTETHTRVFCHEFLCYQYLPKMGNEKYLDN
jgi:predicted RNA binding protein YcfA (HicA-like mRNA interferase family)